MFTRADQYSLSSFDMVKNYLHGVDLFPIVQPLFHRSHVKILPLLYYYFHGKCSVELHSLIPSDHTFTSRTRYANSTESNFLLIQEKVPLRQLFPKCCYFVKQIPAWGFPEQWLLQASISSSFLPISIILISYHLLFHWYHKPHYALLFLL